MDYMGEGKAKSITQMGKLWGGWGLSTALWFFLWTRHYPK